MPVQFQLPPDLETQLRREFPDLDEQAREAFAVEGFRAGRLSIGQVAAVLGKSVYEAQGFLKRRGAGSGLSAAEVDADIATLRKLRE
jgi:predicted HTH domain antitoxin